jgi:hypothetical protein
MESQIRTATVHEIKDELQHLPPAKVVELCIRLSRFKKENKELLTYLLFESNDMEAYLQLVKKETENLFTEINSTSLYFAKKTIRKILRIINKQIRFTGSKHAEAELLTHYCSCLKHSGIPFQKSNALLNLYNQQLKKIEKAVEGMHEDLQYEYHKKLVDIQL